MRQVEGFRIFPTSYEVPIFRSSQSPVPQFRTVGCVTVSVLKYSVHLNISLYLKLKAKSTEYSLWFKY